MEYEILEDTNIYDLALKVDEYLADGWIPQGGVSVVVLDDEDGEDRYWCTQAVIRKE